MFLSFWIDALFDILLVIAVSLLIIAVSSVFLIRDLRKDYKQVIKIRSKFHIEIRKMVNLIYNIHSPKQLEPFSKVIIKNLPHEEKKILIKIIDEVYQEIDKTDIENKYVIETYENLQKLRRKRDALILVYNQKLRIFPFSIYAKILKMSKYDLYTDAE